ncbi:MAG: hypothetical protein IPM53_19745 [Anaerolineaceae bacterium]|nr:hypothetical protein [Anaerolineaceae bacterium]
MTYEDLFLKEGHGLISAYILGHLQIEFLLLKIVEAHSPSLRDFSHKLTHYKLVELVYGLQLITPKQKAALLEINKFRNKFAHDILFEPSVADFVKLFSSAQNAFSDMTDGISQGLSELEELTVINENFEFTLSDMFSQVLYDLHQIYCDNGGDFWEFNEHQEKESNSANSADAKSRAAD